MEEMSLINFVVFIIKLSFSQIALKKHLLIALIKIILFYVDLWRVHIDGQPDMWFSLYDLNNFQLLS